MSEENRCTQCQAILSVNAPHGLCPGCLLKRGLDTQTQYSQEGSQAAAAECAPPTPEEMTGLFPDLEILELVGRGGMGVVYKARQKRLNRVVALKILAPRFSQDAAFAERFVREARAMAMLSHPHIVAVYDFGEVDGLYYFIMEFVDGVNLRRLLDTGKLASEEALAIVPQICDALQYAHDHGVVHRDIKPENVLLDKEGRVQIADFGIAKLVGAKSSDLEMQNLSAHGAASPESPSASREPLTAVGQVVGTPQYMAPEQIKTPQQVDHRADIYSLGVVFYQMLTGELPTGQVAPPSNKVQIDVRLDEVVLRAMEKEPHLRYQQVSEVKTEVEDIASTPSKPLPPTDATPSLSPEAKTDDAIEQARQQVKGPAIGLLVTGIFTWLTTLPIAMLMVSWDESVLGSYGLSIPLLLTIPIFLMTFSGLAIFAALKMQQLQLYRLAMTISILAIIVSPSNLIGLPIGIWALIVLNQRDVRAAFLKNQEASGTVNGTQARWASVLTLAIGVFLSILVVVNTLNGHMLTAIGAASLIAIFVLIAEALRKKPNTLRVTILASLLVLLLIVALLRIAEVIPEPILRLNEAPRQQWQAATKIDGPGIDRVLIKMDRAIIEGEASTKSRIIFAASDGYQSCGFKKKGRFTAVVKASRGRDGLDISVVDADGEQILTSHMDGLGNANFQANRVFFGESLPKPGPDGAIQIAQVSTNGDLIPLTVRLTTSQPSKPKDIDKSSSEEEKEAPSPDILPSGNIQPLDLLQIHAINALLSQPIHGYYLVEPDGSVSLGPAYGRVNVNGLSTEQAEQSILKQLDKILKEPDVQVVLAKRLSRWRKATFPRVPYIIEPKDSIFVKAIGIMTNHPIDGPFTVEPKGTIPLGPAYGRVKVQGLTLEAAEKAITKHLEKILNEPEVQVTLPHNFVNSPAVRWKKIAMPKTPYTIKPGELLMIDTANTLIDQPIEGVHLVEPGGTIALGLAYGRVKVEDLTLEEAEKAIKKKLKTILIDPEVSVTLGGWIDKGSNSK